MTAMGKINELEQEQMPDIEGANGMGGSPSMPNVPSGAKKHMPSGASTPNVSSGGTPTGGTADVSSDVPASIANHEHIISTN